MRVLHVLPSISSQSGGPVRSTLANCRALSAVGTKLSVTLTATDHGLDSKWREEFISRMPAGTDLKIFPAIGRHAFTLSAPLFTWLWRHIPDYDLVVVRALLNPISSSGARISRRHGVPYLVVPHGTLSEYTFEHRRTWLKRAYFRLVEKGTLSGAAAVRFTSESERDQAPAWGHDTPTPVIPHPFESRDSPLEQNRAHSRNVLFLSRFHPIKGLDVLLPAFAILKDRIPDTKLVLAGAGSDTYEGHLRDEICRLDLCDTVTLPGFVEGKDKDGLLGASSVFVLPSLQENFGVAVVEAMDAGLPVVISRGVGIWREVEEANAGLVVDRDAQTLANSLLELLRDPERAQQMGANGQELVKAHFDPQRIGRELHTLYWTAAGVQVS